MQKAELNVGAQAEPEVSDCCAGLSGTGLLKMAATYSVALSTPLVILALLGCLVMPLGWRVAGALFLPHPEDSGPQPAWLDDARWLQQWPGQRVGWLSNWLMASAARTPLGARTAPGSVLAAGDTPVAGADERPAAPAVGESRPGSGAAVWVRTASPTMRGLPEDPVLSVPYRLMKPVYRVFDRTLSWSVWLFFVMGALWNLSVWALAGGAICRMAALRLGRAERVGFRESLQFARSRWIEFLTAPLLPLVAILLMAFPLVMLGFVMRSDWGMLLGGLFYVVALISGLLMAILGIGLAGSWPLMWGAVASEGSDSFDAISRSYAYVIQRPLAWLGYVVSAAIVAALGWCVTSLFCEAILASGFWGLAVGMGDQRAADVWQWIQGSGRPAAVALPGYWLIMLLIDVTRLTASAISYGHFWCLATLVYLLLRRDVDQTELNELFLDQLQSAELGLNDDLNAPAATTADHTSVITPRPAVADQRSSTPAADAGPAPTGSDAPSEVGDAGNSNTGNSNTGNSDAGNSNTGNSNAADAGAADAGDSKP
jgi:hypothetical protein